MAARTADEILTSFQSSVALSDPSVDTSKGPMYSLIGKPFSEVLAPTETEVERLAQIYSSEFALIATDAEATAFLNNWGEALGTGAPATVTVYFMTFTRPKPGTVISIDIGSLVGNSDQTLQYVTVEGGQINGDFADSFFNATRRAYEVGLLCQAVANGSQYELPSGRITTKVSNLPGVDAIENRSATTPGAAAETNTQGIQRVQQKFKGLAINTGNGSYSRIKNYAPTSILDVKTILSSNRQLFKRIVYGPAKDYYILGTVPKTVIQTYKAIGGELTIPLVNVPTISLNSVTINSTPITNFTLRSDTSPELGLSAKAQDQCVLAFPLLPNDVVSMSVTYNSIIQDVQNNVLSTTQLFNTDELAREFIPMPIRIYFTGRALASTDPLTVQNAVIAELDSLISLGVWTEAFYPNTILQQIIQNVAGLSNPQMIKFQRSTQATANVEIVLIKENEIAIYDPNFVSVQIRNV
jgi:hypothetical protein